MITARPATKADMTEIYRFICELEEVRFDQTIFEQLYLHNIASEHYFYIVVADALDKAIGFISCHGQVLLHHGGWVFEIQEMFVDTPFRNQGLGTILLHYLETQIAKYDYRSLEVTASINRTETHAWYKAYGFRQTHKKFTKEKDREPGI